MREIENQIEEYLSYCRKKQSPDTIKNKTTAFNNLLADTPLQDIRELTNKIVEDWVAVMLKRKAKPQSVNTYVGCLPKFVKYARKIKGYKIPIELQEIERLKQDPSTRVAYTREEIEFVLQYANEMVKLQILIKFEAGMRITELSNLTLDNFTDRRINYIGKGKVKRESYISEPTKAQLDDHITQNNICDYLWVKKRGKSKGEPYSSSHIREIMKKTFFNAADDLGKQIARGEADQSLLKLVKKLRKFCPHTLRHSFGTDLQEKGATLFEIQKMLGHAHAATTERYLHGFEGQMGDLFDKYQNPEITIAQTTLEDSDIKTMLRQLLKAVDELKIITAKK
jgi:integrase/recombinase XerD